MNKSKQSNFHKIIALVLIAIVIISAVGFVANGWQPIINSGDGNGNVDNKNDNAGNDKNGNNANDNPVVALPKYYSYLTGLEVTEDESIQLPISFLTNPSLQLYGIYDSPLSIEFPTENGDTRMLVYSSNITSLGKIGNIQPTRNYISNMLSFFGGAMISFGNDDLIDYKGIDITKKHLDLTKASTYHYTEDTKKVYSNGDLIRAGLSALDIQNQQVSKKRIPFEFNDIDAEKIYYKEQANSVTIPYSETNETKFIYNDSSCKYLFMKSNNEKIDSLNGKNIEYNNVFVLFSDSTTHETYNGTELIMNTLGSGKGYYFTGGTYKEIRWSSENEAMVFYDENDDKLTVNRGTSYIAYVKATKSSEVIISK